MSANHHDLQNKKETTKLKHKLTRSKEYVLFVLFINGPMHGYSIRKKVFELVEVDLSTTLIYMKLVDLLESGLIELVDLAKSNKGPNKKIYSLTEDGINETVAIVKRYETILKRLDDVL